MLEDPETNGLLDSLEASLESMRTGREEQYVAIEPFVEAWLDEEGQDGWLSGNWLRWAWLAVEEEMVSVPRSPLSFALDDQRSVKDARALPKDDYLYIPQESE